MQKLFRSDPDQVVWWFSEIECVSALARLERDGRLVEPALQNSFQRLDGLRVGWTEIEAISTIRRHARRLVRVHRLRAADAGQLAAALVASEGDTESLEFVTLDDRLNAVALREGFVVPQFEA